AVAGRLDGCDERLERHVRRTVDGRLLGGEVDGRVDPVQPAELLLDSRGARGAGHALELEPHSSRLVLGGGSRGSHSQALYPVGVCLATSASSASAANRPVDRTAADQESTLMSSTSKYARVPRLPGSMFVIA